ncbi:DUF4097 family beta strand repeat-containing protein [Streptomyces sp. HB2AG]|uniref:DUF4097 family beta strand repeat-containing protein n=1 Tax=Streptomyces sp. HB2AG TaxID=2983400 RepID=UPI0022AA9181|nr:DUF4097 family beta strand repeat-containing protein [Streptomyces sp. HB2AG]MCZ2523295.1 DUF4097 family beta strand repeat-containing protein [Streptomyces sp. HB2AG]
MRLRSGSLAVAAAVLFGAGGLGACGLLPGETFEDDAVVSEAITSVRLDNDSGRVELRGGKDLTEVSVHRSVDYRGDRPEGATHRVENGVLVLGDCGGSCSVSYTVDLPAGLPVSGGTSAGSITLSEVGEVAVSTGSGSITLDGVGEVAVTTGSGSITLNGVTGPVDARTSNGRITGRGLEGGPVRVQTSNGAVDLTVSAPQDVRAHTSNGAVELTVPAGRYRVSASTSNGEKDIGVTDDPAGKHRIELVTSNGDITVRPA